MTNSNWKVFAANFSNIIDANLYYTNITKGIIHSSTNTLLYCAKGFPIDLFIDHILRKKFNTQHLYKNVIIWNKHITYLENQNFFEIDLMNPDNIKDLDCLSDFILHIIKNKDIGQNKHSIILKNIDHLSEYFFEFRILLERYSPNVMFICTTHAISKIEAPIKSRFNLYRVPLFTYNEINQIFNSYLQKQLNPDLANTRNIIKAIFIADVQDHEPYVINSVFTKYNFPPLYDFLLSYDKNKDNLEEVRNLSYKACQYNISILNLVEDLIQAVDNTELITKKFNKIPNKHLLRTKNAFKKSIIETGANIEYCLCQTNKGREPIYIENFLTQLL
jgi:hypothetical protein